MNAIPGDLSHIITQGTTYTNINERQIYPTNYRPIALLSVTEAQSVNPTRLLEKIMNMLIRIISANHSVAEHSYTSRAALSQIENY